MALSARQTIEMFHLVFLRALAAKGEDKSLFALKGGCNLRFFFQSVRYSEDIDIDASIDPTADSNTASIETDAELADVRPPAGEAESNAP